MAKNVFRVVAFTCLVMASAVAGQEPTRITVREKVLAKINPLIFGQMFECAWAGAEIGAEGAWDQKRGAWQERFVELVRELGPTNIRWPGGWWADHYDWRNAIDNVPGRPGPRPVLPRDGQLPITHSVGIDEVLELCREVGAEPIFVVNFGDFVRGGNMPDGAKLAADWVEYCNAPNDGKNPHGGVDWAAVRAKNGHLQPFQVKYWELANEVWILTNQMPAMTYQFYAEWATQYVSAMREVDSTIVIIADGQDKGLREAVTSKCGDNVQHLAVHYYAPFHLLGADFFSDADVWRYFMSCPSHGWVQDYFGGAVRWKRETRPKVRLALTEWNWKGGWMSVTMDKTRTFPLRLEYNKRWTNFGSALGAAVILHDIVRHADVVDIGCVSLLAGNSWEISTIRCDPTAKRRCFRYPTFHVFKMYRHNSGDRLLEVRTEGAPTYDLDWPFGWGFQPTKGLSYLDVVASRGDKTLYLAVINRHLTDDLAAIVNLEGHGVRYEAKARRVVFTAAWDAENTFEKPDAVTAVETEFMLKGLPFNYVFPARSATILCLPLGS